MKKQIKIWISVGVEAPHEFSLNENALKNYIDEQKKIGFRRDDYNNSKNYHFIQCVNIDEKRINKIIEDNQGYFWSVKSLEGSSCQVLAVSDTMSNIATQISKLWKMKITKEHLIKNYSVNSLYTLEAIDGHSEVQRLQVK